jgi:helicase
MWVNEKNEEEMTAFYNIGPGDVRNLMETCVWLMHSTAEISNLLKSPLTRDARDLAVRVDYGVSKELMDLIELEGVGRVRARKLYEAGYKDREAVRKAELEALAALLGEKVASKILAQLGRKDVVVSDEPDEDIMGQSTLFSFGH